VVPGYRLVRLVSRAGGPTVVWEARHAGGAPVAVKGLSPGAPPDQLHRFQAEAALLERLGGRHRVVRLIEALAEPPALVLEWAAGGSLRDRIHPGGLAAPPAPLSLEATIRLGLELGEALEWLHGQGVFHRDVKPGNVLLDAAGGALVADFSVAAQGDPPRSLPEGWIEEDAGTLGYAAPELLRDPGAASPAIDLYGLGATLYEALTGRLPHDLGPTETERELRWRLARGAPPVPLGERGCRAPGLAELVERALDPDPARRPSIGELRVALGSGRTVDQT
jgi:serine/threonine protein kinase